MISTQLRNLLTPSGASLLSSSWFSSRIRTKFSDWQSIQAHPLRILLARSILERFQARDYDFVVNALTKPQGDKESRSLCSLLIESEALNNCLDHFEFIQHVLQQTAPLTISPELYFYVFVSHTLKNANTTDRGVADYVATNLAICAHGNPMEALQKQDESSFDYHIYFLRALDQASPCEKFFLQVHCSNQFLLLTRLLPKFLRLRRYRTGTPRLRYYGHIAQGAYLRASGHPLAEECESKGTYHTLANRFGQMRHALNHSASDYLFLDV